MHRAAQADRSGRAPELAAAYAASDLCRANAQQLQGAAAAGAAATGVGRFRMPPRPGAEGGAPEQLDAEAARDLATRHETTTSFWWGYRTLMKVLAGAGIEKQCTSSHAGKPLATLVVWRGGRSTGW
jgi:hypothetical protein